LGILLGGTLTKKTPDVVVREVRNDGLFVRDENGVRALQFTPRELEILGLIAQGLSNKEIPERAFVSENTAKTHASRVFDKLGARRRTGAAQLGKSRRLIP
jgi:NarL family two-component system response regulator LiaR